MRTPQITGGLAVTAAAFLVAFAIGKAANDSEATGAPARAESIDVGDAVISADVATGARLPAMKREQKRRPKKEKSSSKDSDQSRPGPGPTPGPTAPPTTRPQPGPTVAPNPDPNPNPRPKPRPKPAPTVIEGGGDN
jgi:outer membrane biosynthesis protein TonB